MMETRVIWIALLACVMGLVSCVGGEHSPAQPLQSAEQHWTESLAEQLPLYGHRNWVLVVDKAFPKQASTGITYIDSGEELPDALAQVLAQINDANHIKPIVYRDAELSHIDEELVPGITTFNEKMSAVLGDLAMEELPHDAVFAKIDEAAGLFGILVVKTEGIMPYTSIFIELDCAYWDAEREQQLRARMNRHR